MYFEHDWTADGPHITRKQRADRQKKMANIFTSYVDTLYNRSLKRLGQLIEKPKSTNTSFYVFNSLNWTRTDYSDYAYVGPTSIRVIDKTNGKEVPFQRIIKKDKPYMRILAANVPSLGYKVFEIQPKSSASPFPVRITVTDSTSGLFHVGWFALYYRTNTLCGRWLGSIGGAIPKRTGEMKTAIGIDVGGTNIKGIILTADGEILKQHFVPTNDDGEGKWRETVQDVVRYLKKSHNEPIELIGLSCPGFADETNSCISYMPGRLSGVEHFQWEACFGTKTYVINDAHAALIAEATFGEIRGYKNAILLTLGTGVGGGLLINGELYQGLSQMAGHFGHLSITPHDDELSLLGMPGSLEYALGNYSIRRRSSGRFSSTYELVQGYKEYDPFASWLWLDSIRKLGLTIASFANVLSPEIIVLAGGITKADTALFTPLNGFLDVYEFRPKNKQTLIKQAKFSDLAGAVGAAAFAFGKLKKVNC